jgi:hypothetical protein
VTLPTLVRRSLTFHWRTNLAVVLGVAAATAVLAGALVVGDSVRQSLREMALGRLGRTDTLVSSVGFFREDVADDQKALDNRRNAADRCRRVRDARVFRPPSVERDRLWRKRRFWSHGQQPVNGVVVSPALAGGGGQRRRRAFDPAAKPSEVPIESLFGRKDESATVRLILPGPAARAARRVLDQTATGGRSRRVCAAVAPAARPWRSRSGQHHPRCWWSAK